MDCFTVWHLVLAALAGAAYRDIKAWWLRRRALRIAKDIEDIKKELKG